MVKVVLSLRVSPDAVTLDVLRRRIAEIFNLKEAEVDLVLDIGNLVFASSSRVTINDCDDRVIPGAIYNLILYHFPEITIVIA